MALRTGTIASAVPTVIPKTKVAMFYAKAPHLLNFSGRVAATAPTLPLPPSPLSTFFYKKLPKTLRGVSVSKPFTTVLTDGGTGKARTPGAYSWGM